MNIGSADVTQNTHPSESPARYFKFTPKYQTNKIIFTLFHFRILISKKPPNHFYDRRLFLLDERAATYLLKYSFRRAISFSESNSLNADAK
ncbi:MAG: hypothetical protein KBH03_08015, partial [Paludibacteraceae bacterium]|nr:hypothetical protein [Paludibacteraceae bacterium]